MTDLTATVRASLSKNALECLEAVAIAREDQDAMIASDLYVGARNTETLLAKCLEGAEGDDVIAGWTEYVEVIGRVAAGHFHQGRTTEETTNQHGRLVDYRTTEIIRPATAEERAACLETARYDGGAGVIDVDGRRCYVED